MEKFLITLSPLSKEYMSKTIRSYLTNKVVNLLAGSVSNLWSLAVNLKLIKQRARYTPMVDYNRCFKMLWQCNVPSKEWRHKNCFFIRKSGFFIHTAWRNTKIDIEILDMCGNLAGWLLPSPVPPRPWATAKFNYNQNWHTGRPR